MISPLAHVDPSAKIGRDVTIHPFAFVDQDTEIGDGCEIMPYASVVHGSRLGRCVKVYQGAIVGADPQDFRWKGQPSYCIIGDSTVVREHVIINRSILPEGATKVGKECFLFADSHIGHDSVLADHVVIGNSVNIAGNVTVGEGTIFSSSAVAHEGSNIGQFVLLKGGTRVSGNVPPFVIMAHNPVVYYGVNSTIMQKHCGYSEEEIDDIAKAYRHIYQTQTSLFNALKRIEADIEAGRVRDAILGFVRANNLKLAGHRFEED